MFYRLLKKEIIKRCLTVEFNDQSLGGESFESIINSVTNKCNLNSNWKRYSKDASGFDQCIKNEEMSIKTILNNKNDLSFHSK